MPVRDLRGQPLPPDHPFAKPTIIFGYRKPEAQPAKPAEVKPAEEQPKPEQPKEP